MKLVKNFLFTVLLVSTFAFNTYAGDIETPGYVPPPPPRMTVSDDDAIVVTGDYTQTGVNTADTSDYFLYEALAALLSVY